MRIRLDEADFRDLVAGKQISHRHGKYTIEVILADIGLVAMIDAIADAMHGHSPEEIIASLRPRLFPYKRAEEGDDD